jgi:hypothetical protein
MNIIGQASIVLIRIRALFWTLCLDLEITTALYALGALALVVLLAGLAVCVVVYKFRWTQNIPIR